MNSRGLDYQGMLAVIYRSEDDLEACLQLAQRLEIPVIHSEEIARGISERYLLGWRNERLTLIDSRHWQKKAGLAVEFVVRSSEQRSWPAAKKGPLAQAIGRKTVTVIDATTGWGQDSFHIFRMGYQVCCMERSPVMAELLKDGLQRLSKQQWVLSLGIEIPQLLVGNATELFKEIKTRADCIYLDPMFPPKRKKSALTRKSMTVLRDLLGDDLDREQLFLAALDEAGKRVVVKSPEYAEPLGGKPDASFQGKLVRYDVYLK